MSPGPERHQTQRSSCLLHLQAVTYTHFLPEPSGLILSIELRTGHPDTELLAPWAWSHNKILRVNASLVSAEPGNWLHRAGHRPLTTLDVKIRCRHPALGKPGSQKQAFESAPQAGARVTIAQENILLGRPRPEYLCPRDGRPQKSQPDFVAGHLPCVRQGISQASEPVISWTGNCGCGGSYDAVCRHRVGLSTRNAATDQTCRFLFLKVAPAAVGRTSVPKMLPGE
ncbi:hypothetical protein E5288_WYG007645 [Bos mutus]|uniref:Uncharacterized protein n=1 Tax=Bos mutus TaxID=72004 RepID=A0A6B0RIE8_9CETA|nr:hypothetical protein [Bos mutus]